MTTRADVPEIFELFDSPLMSDLLVNVSSKIPQTRGFNSCPRDYYCGFTSQHVAPDCQLLQEARMDKYCLNTISSCKQLKMKEVKAVVIKQWELWREAGCGSGGSQTLDVGASPSKWLIFSDKICVTGSKNSFYLLVPVHHCIRSKLRQGCFPILPSHLTFFTFLPYTSNLSCAGDKEQQQCGQAVLQGQLMSSVCQGCSS